MAFQLDPSAHAPWTRTIVGFGMLLPTVRLTSLSLRGTHLSHCVIGLQFGDAGPARGAEQAGRVLAGGLTSELIAHRPSARLAGTFGSGRACGCHVLPL